MALKPKVTGQVREGKGHVLPAVEDTDARGLDHGRENTVTGQGHILVKGNMTATAVRGNEALLNGLNESVTMSDLTVGKENMIAQGNVIVKEKEIEKGKDGEF